MSVETTDVVAGLRWWIRNNLGDKTPEKVGLEAALDVVEAALSLYPLGDNSSDPYKAEGALIEAVEKYRALQEREEGS